MGTATDSKGFGNAIVNEWETQDFKNAQKRLDKTAVHLKLDANTVEPMRHPKRSLSVVVPARMDDGTVQTFMGYRVHHDLALGPGKGGLRFHGDVTLGQVASMAMLMTWKCSLMNLPFGGAHGGIRLNPGDLSSGELERITRRYTSEILELIGPTQDIAGPDLNTDEQTMAWIMDTYSVNIGYTVPSIVTGKPQSIGGSLGVLQSTGYGVALAAKRAATFANLKGDSPSVIIQGLGNVGSAVARNLTSAGFKVVGVSDAYGGLYNKKGLAIEDLMQHIEKQGNMYEFADADKVTNEELLELECDILAPCAVSNQLHAGNADNLKCKVVVEGANAPTTPNADDVLDAKGVIVVPDILANAAGVTVGYFEWVQGLMHLFWTEEEVYQRLDQLVNEVCTRVFTRSTEEKISLRMAAMSIAVERIVEARKMRGLYP
ncbi:MAG: Glu/Leu/Phe/Val dehydrogenase [Cyanobacteria bacterium REEB67]|nr:Glu/Leu/Phe/Val dehydrogenase [Cyanobacteria bacterium REEB67]